VLSEDLLFVTGGGIRADYLITRDGQAHNNNIGGNAIYAACGAAIWSDSVSVWGRIGDNYPKIWTGKLADYGINGSGLKRLNNDQDHRTFYAYQADGTREDTQPEKHYARIGQPMPEALVSYRDSTPAQDDPEVFEPLALRKEDWPSIFQGIAAVHLAPLPLRTHLEVVPFLREIGVGQITVDPGERYMRPQLGPYLRRFLPLVDVFLPSAQEIVSLFGPNIDLLSAAKTLGEWGAKLIVIKHGSRGVLLYKEGWPDLVRLDAFHAKGDEHIVDVTGAGDSFCGGFMVGLAMKKGLEHAARLGLASASFTVEGYGALYPLQSTLQERTDRLLALERRQSR
jgi:sugar/nucleoside kinase (ribokinase family)